MAIMRPFRFVACFAPNEWWRHFPFLPVPTWRYIKFRQTTMYGREGVRMIPRMALDFPQFYRAWCAYAAHIGYPAGLPVWRSQGQQ